MTEWSKVFEYLRKPDAPSVEQRIRFNPRPRGQVRPGSAADAILRLLRANPDRTYWRHQLIHITGCTRKSVDWALSYLQALQHVEAIEIPGVEIGGCLRQSRVRFRLRGLRADEGEVSAASTWPDVADAPRNPTAKD